ncbi:type II secretion system protein [Microbacterium sp. ET2]|uniref:type II secretion system protein n=1 Tax=Microbacterium albipurpureum TaxID=3050384 RepID=UPI00259CC72F|nr:type II secretion system protein [Microbacterium sp. ET2 (Ac-2212)]WJL94338.1 type II secretion system protein [Microbacterium sp. ET2 (Ac-2212)]
MKHYLDALKRRKEETGESGFSLIELIVVVVILGILAAIAIPVFMNLQSEAETNALRTAAANGASQVAAEIAKGEAPDPSNLSEDAADGIKVALTLPAAGTPTLDNFCVTASKTGQTSQTSGPGCS